MEFVALCLIILVGWISWNAGVNQGRSEGRSSERELLNTHKRFFAQKLAAKMAHQSALGIRYVNYPLIESDASPLVLLSAKDLIDLAASEHTHRYYGNNEAIAIDTWDAVRARLVDGYLNESTDLSQTDRRRFEGSLSTRPSRDLSEEYSDE